MTIELQLLTVTRQRLANRGLAAHDIVAVNVQRNVIEVRMRVRMVPQLRARLQPQIQYLLQARPVELGSTCVHESDDRNVLLAKRAQQLVGHGLHACQIARPSVAAARQIIDRNGDLPASFCCESSSCEQHEQPTQPR